MSFPQLRVRTEYSFRANYGPVERVAARLKDIECPAAAIVDSSGTWGHVQWEKALKGSGVKALFGTEFVIPTEDGRKPKCWVIATHLPSFYRLSSSPPTNEKEMAESKGVIRFAGAALTDPRAFDYIDINPRSRRQTKRALDLAKKTGKPLVVTSDNDYPAPEDKARFLAWDDSEKMTPQHLLTEKEIRAALSYVPKRTLDKAIKNTYALAAKLRALKLRTAPMIRVDGDFEALVEVGRKYRLERGHIAEWTEEYEARLQREIKLIKEKEYESYFIVVAEMICWAKERMLVGPARGSSAGSLVCYCMRITEVDPLIHGLIFERFIDVNRSDLPDIDVDFNDKKRELVFDHLHELYGVANVARIGSVNRLKPRSVMAHVGKKMGIPAGATFNVINVLVEHSSGDARYGHALEDTLEGTQVGKDFLERYPEASLIGEIENHASHTGQHAAGIIVANVPVIEYCTVRDGIAHIDKKDAEYLNLLKIDALGLRTLGVIEDTGCISPQELYDLTLDDPSVFRIIDEKKYSGIFQFEGRAQRSVAVHIPIESFKKIDHITALARPGPLGGGAATTYINRNSGTEKTEYRHPSMEAYLGDTFGVVLYQEQVMRIVREIGGFSWEETSTIRKAMSGRKGEEFFNKHIKQFVRGAKKLGMDKETAEAIWNEICSFGAWGMNKSHTVSYSIISYWCAYMKRNFELEYAAACLRSAKDDEQVIEILRELNAEGVSFVPFDPDLSEANWTAKDGKLVGGFTNLIGIGPVKAAQYIEKRHANAISPADREALAKRVPKHRDLFPAHTRWRDIYENPSAYNIHGPVKEFGQLEDNENAVIIGKLIKQDRRDKNEQVLISKRDGEIYKGQSLFLDSFLVDDSVSQPIRVRTQPRDWFEIGEKMADRAVPGEDWFLIRGRWLGDFNMMIAKKMKCLTNERMFE